jgi:uncharacterized protein (DUF433 family)
MSTSYPAVARRQQATDEAAICIEEHLNAVNVSNRLRRCFGTPGPQDVAPHADLSASITGMIDWSSCVAVERDPERVSGAWVFRGTRVPIAALFENLEDGIPVGKFIELFQGVTLEQARQVLEHAARSALTAA